MNYKKLYNDNKEGLVSKFMTLVMDNDGGYWRCNNPDLNESEQDKLCQEYFKNYGTPKGYSDIVEILNAWYKFRMVLK